MAIEIQKKDGVSVLTFSGRVTIGDGDVAMREGVVDLLEAGERRFIFNMGSVSFLDSSGIGETVASARRISRLGGCAKLVLQEEGKVRDVFVITGLHRSFEIFTDEEQALASFMHEV